MVFKRICASAWTLTVPARAPIPVFWVTKEEQAREVKKEIKETRQTGQEWNGLVIESERLNLSLVDMRD